jgi:hypothetical protein
MKKQDSMSPSKVNNFKIKNDKDHSQFHDKEVDELSNNELK